MRLRYLLCAAAAAGAIVLPETRVNRVHAQVDPPAAVTGRVSSGEDGPLEGVLVSARKAGSTITLTVVTDQQGQYRFPQSRLEPGQYSLRIRAAGYDLESPTTADVVEGKTTTKDLTVRKARDLASQLSNAEWIASVPGTVAEKAILAAVLALPYLGKDPQVAAQRGAVGPGDRADGHLPAAVVPAEDSETAGAADRRRRRVAGATAGGAGAVRPSISRRLT